MSHFKPLVWSMHKRAKTANTKSYKDELMGIINREITSIAIPDDVTTIGNGAFSYCHQLSSLTLPSNLEYMASNVFNYCECITSVEIPAGVTTVSYNSFANCTGLTEVTFLGTPNAVIYTAFNNCTNLLTINVPWAEGKVANAPWGATNATINYNYTA